jgi:hypothetical protein
MYGAVGLDQSVVLWQRLPGQTRFYLSACVVKKVLTMLLGYPGQISFIVLPRACGSHIPREVRLWDRVAAVV